MYHLFPDDYKGVICVYFDNCTGLVRRLVVPAEAADIVHSVDDLGRDLPEEMRRGLSADVRRSGDERVLELGAERVTKGLMRYPDTYRTILRNQV